MTRPRAFTPDFAARLKSHPAPRFAVVGAASVVVDVGLLRLLYGSLGVPLLVATATALGASVVVNFLLNRNWAFAHGHAGHVNPQFLRFSILCGLNLISTLIIVGVLATVGLNYLLAKLIAIALNTVANYFAYSRWVFRG